MIRGQALDGKGLNSISRFSKVSSYFRSRFLERFVVERCCPITQK